TSFGIPPVPREPSRQTSVQRPPQLFHPKPVNASSEGWLARISSPVALSKKGGGMYRRLALIFALLILGLSCWSRLSSAEDSHMTAELEHLNQIWEQAWLDKDAALVEKLMADEYVYIAPNGKIMDRDSILKIIRSPSYHLDYGTRTEVVVKAVSQDTAVVVHRAQDGGSL